MLRDRLIFGPILIAALVLALWLDERLAVMDTPQWLRGVFPWINDRLPPGIALVGLGVVVCPLAAKELAAIFRAGSIQASAWWMSVSAIGGLLVSALILAETPAIVAISVVSSVAAVVLVGSVILNLRDRDPKGATAASGAALFAFVYIGLMFGFLLALRRVESAWVVLGVLMVTKACDTGAFFTGRAIGRHKLIPWLSPGKTWEGLVGGVLLSVAVALCLQVAAGVWLPEATIGKVSLIHGVVLGVILGLAGQAGDLLASTLKRDAGIKDSGKSLPGFGGVLDVADSVVLAAPLAYWYLRGLEAGVL